VNALDRWRRSVQRNDRIRQQSTMEIRSKDGTVVLHATTPPLPADDPVLRYSVEQTLRDAADWCAEIIRDPGPKD
jgi:hypothetical protein